MNTLFRDLRYALRQLRGSPAFTFTALLTLAIGIGATAAVYSVIQTVLLEPLPFTEPDRIVGLAWSYPGDEPNAEQTGAGAEYVRDHVQAFSSSAILEDNIAAVNLSVSGGHPANVNSLHVSEDYFRTLGVMPMLGRGFVADEDRPGGARAVVLSEGVWKRVFASDAGVVGRAVRVNQDTFTVVGVMPAGFRGAGEGGSLTPDLWLPLQLSPKDPGYEGDNYEMIARLKPGVTLAALRQQLSALQQPFYDQFPDFRKWYSRGHQLHDFRAFELKEVIAGQVRRSLLTVMGAVVAVLLVACLNLAGLMMARTMRRSREMALRSALGATRGQLARLLATEGLLLALGGGLLAVLSARAGTYVLLHAAPLDIPNLRGEPSQWLLNAVVFAVALAATLVFCMLPAWVMLRRRTREMRLGGPSLGEAISHARLSRLLMVAQVALAMVLVSTASVLVGTFVRLREIPPGIEPKQLSVFQVTLKGDRYASTLRTTQFVSQVLDRLRSAPGVDRVAAVNGLPLDRGLNMGGNPIGRPELRQIVEFRSVTPGYFEAMGIPLIAGRDFTAGDHAGGDPVIVIGATAAKKWWPGRSPIGGTVHLGGKEAWRIIGVAADVQMHSLVESQGIVVYGPMVQLADDFTAVINGWFPTTFVVRTAAGMNLAEIAQRAVEQADPEIPVARLTSMQAVVDRSIREPRFFSLLAGGFSLFAVALTVIGLFGLLSYQVAQRTREIGVRMALGADRVAILRTFLGRGLAVASIGVALGLIASWLARPVVSHLLADAGINDSPGAQAVVMNSAMAIAVAAVAILMATLAASWLPARRAASVEPMEALRTE